MIGSRVGTKTGSLLGAAVGSVADDETPSGVDPMAGVTRDAASGKYFPANAAEWTITRAAAGISSGNPANLWLCQEASGNLADSIGGTALAVAGTWNYQQAVTGFTRLAVVNPTDGLGARFTSAGDEISTSSEALFAVVQMPASGPGGTRSVMEVGTNATRDAIELANVGPVLRGRSVANIADGTHDFTNAVRPCVLVSNRTGTEVIVATDQEKLLPTFGGTMAGTLITFGGVAGGNLCPNMGLMYACRFSGAAAELSAAQVKSLLQVLGWSIPWS